MPDEGYEEKRIGRNLVEAKITEPEYRQSKCDDGDFLDALADEIAGMLLKGKPA